VLSNETLIVRICLVIHEIIANKAFIVTDSLISWLFVVTFIYLTYMWTLEYLIIKLVNYSITTSLIYKEELTCVNISLLKPLLGAIL